jgi:hypothetical protein
LSGVPRTRTLQAVSAPSTSSEELLSVFELPEEMAVLQLLEFETLHPLEPFVLLCVLGLIVIGTES